MAAPPSSAERERARQDIEAHFREAGEPVRLHPVSGGTLGLCFRFDRLGRKRFLKTHMDEEGCRENLVKEASILSRLYGERIAVETMVVQAERERFCLIMNELEWPAEPFDADAVRGIIDGFGAASDAIPGGTDIFSSLLDLGLAATEELAGHERLVDDAVLAEVRRHLRLLERERHRLPPALCHGDLGPKNIMMDARGAVAIDWEDAFVGVAGYDFLYWLTFMQNRRFLSEFAIGSTPYGRELEVGILLLVVTLKSLLAVRSGQHLGHSLSVEDRLTEILRLPG